MTGRALVTVSGTIPDDLAAQIAGGTRPRADYQELSRALDGDTVDIAAARAASGRFGRLVGRVAGGSALLGWYCFRQRKRYDVVLTDAENVGFAYALLTQFVRRRPRHVLVAHRLSPMKKIVAHRALGLRRRIDGVIVYSSPQRDVAIRNLGYRPEQVLLTPFMVDTEFWRATPTDVEQPDRPLVCAVGQELRDYPTMAEAVRGLPVDVVLAAASPWSRRRDTSTGIDIPANVTVSSFDLHALRGLYDRASLVVVPLLDTDFQAGITTILEAMSMERTVICTRTEGQTDTLRDGETGRYVAPGDVDGLRRAIVDLTGAADERTTIARAARAWVVQHADIEQYARRLSRFAREGAQDGDAFTSPS